MITILTLTLVGIMVWFFYTINKDYLNYKPNNGTGLIIEDDYGYDSEPDILFDLTDFFYWLVIILCIELSILGLIRLETSRTILPLVLYTLSVIIFYIRVIPNIKLYIRETIYITLSLGLVIFFAIYN